MNKPVVAIVMGSDSDLPVMQEAAKILVEFRVNYEMMIVSAHRTPKHMFDFANSAHTRGIKVIIAGAGGAAHLPGMISAISPLPVIGVPIKTKSMDGADSLYSIVQMPPGVPTATVAINGAKNAGILAVQMLSVNDSELVEKIIKYKKNLKNTVLEKSEELKKIGYQKYLDQHPKK